MSCISDKLRSLLVSVLTRSQRTMDTNSDYRQYRVEISPTVNFKVKSRESCLSLAYKCGCVFNCLCSLLDPLP